MASVDLLIYGKNYAIACDPGEEERVRGLAQMIDQRARQLGPAASDAQRFLMICLMLADELDEAQTALSAPKRASNGAKNGISVDDDLLINAVNHLSERIDHIAGRLAK